MGAISACIVLVYGYSFIHTFVVPVIMITILVYKKRRIKLKQRLLLKCLLIAKQYIIYLLIWFLCSFAMGGMIDHFINGTFNILTIVRLAVLFAGTIYAVSGRRYLERNRGDNDNKNDNIYKISFVHNNKIINGYGYFDSGNSLFEPISGKPVFVGEYDELYPYLTDGEIKYIHMFPSLPDEWDGKTRIRSIPYVSIGNSRGHLPGIAVNELTLTGKSKSRLIDSCYLAVYFGRLSEDKSYNYLLQKNMKL